MKTKIVRKTVITVFLICFLIIPFSVNAQTSSCDEIGYDITKNEFLSNFVFPLLIEFVGAFLGFFSAIQINKLMKRKEFNDVKDGLLAELKSISTDLETTYGIAINKNKEYQIDKTKEIVNYYDTPIWDILLASGELASILNNSKRLNIDFLDLYSDIFKARTLENEFLVARRNNIKLDDSMKEYIKILQDKKTKLALQIYLKIKDLE